MRSRSWRNTYLKQIANEVKIDKYHLNLAGEYRVCAEILKRNIFATVTYGNKKGADIYAIGENKRTAVIEVKASNSSRFVTGFYQKYKKPDMPHPDFWVLYSVGRAKNTENNDEFDEHFYVLTHEEMAEAQAGRNSPRKDLDYLAHVERAAKGVDNVLSRNVEQHENCWNKIEEYFRQT